MVIDGYEQFKKQSGDLMRGLVLVNITGIAALGLGLAKSGTGGTPLILIIVGILLVAVSFGLIGMLQTLRYVASEAEAEEAGDAEEATDEAK